MALRVIDNAPTPTSEIDRPRKQHKLSIPLASIQKNKRSCPPTATMKNNENQAPPPQPNPETTIEFEYIASEDFKPLSDVEAKFQTLVEGLESKDWTVICLDEPQEINRFQLVEMPATDFAGADFEFFPGESEDGCSQYCLVDCLCASAAFLDKRCWKKRFLLSNGRVGPETRSKAFIKVRTGNSTLNPGPDQIDQTTQVGGLGYWK